MTYVRFPNSDIICYVPEEEDNQKIQPINRHVENLTFWIPVDNGNAWAELTSVSKTFFCGQLTSFLHDVKNSFQVPDNVPAEQVKFLRFFVSDNSVSVTCYLIIDPDVEEGNVKDLNESWFWCDLLLIADAAEEED